MSDREDRPPTDHAHPTASPAGHAGSEADAPDSQERQAAMFTHLSGLAGFLIPFGNVIAPLIIWQIKKDQMPFVDDQGKEAVNFQITVTIAVLICLVLTVILIGLLLLPLVAIGALVLTIIAAVRANEGARYRYPLTLRLIR